MPEGPLLLIFKEQTEPFIGRKVTRIENNTKLDLERAEGKTITDIKTWGKHFLICFDDFAFRFHFLMFGNLYINAFKPSGLAPKLAIHLGKDVLRFNSTAIRLIEQPLDEVYDWSADFLNDTWDTKKAKKKLKEIPDTLVCDALLDQTIFAGLGNIIKNEVLFRTRVNPLSKTGSISSKKWTGIIEESIRYGWEFYKYRKEGTLRKHWEANQQKMCPRDDVKFIKENTGVLQRRSFYCNECQKLYS